MAPHTFRRAERGQTLIEFAMVSVLFVFMLVITFNAVLAFSIQQYLSYATFMTARAYQAAADSPQTQVKNAMATLHSYVPGIEQTGQGLSVPLRFQGFPRELATITRVFVPSGGPGKVPIRPDLEEISGENANAVVLEFSVDLASLPLGSFVRQELGKINLVARSSLGRQVTQQECRAFFKIFFKRVSPPITTVGRASAIPPDQYPLYMEDNGC